MIATRRQWRIVVLAKAFLALVVFGTLYAQFNVAQFRAAYAQWPPGGTAVLASRFSTWDAAHYLRLSQSGYEAGAMSCAFYPLWPATVILGTDFLAGRPTLAGVLLANLLSFLGFWMFYQLVARRSGHALGRDSLILILAFPAALFFAFPYSESLYFAIVMVFFWGLELRRWSWVGVAGFLLPLARPVGVFVLLPLAWYLYESQGGQLPLSRTDFSSETERSPIAKVQRKMADGTPIAQSILHAERSRARATRTGGRKWQATNGGWTAWLLLLCPLLGYAGYFGLMWLWTGNAFEAFDAQKAYPNSPSIRNMFDYADLCHAILNVRTLDGMMDSIVDRLFFLVFLGFLPLIYRLDKVWFFYVLPTGLVPALTSWFMSYRRYIMVLFPLFVVLAQLLARTRQRWIFWYYVALLAVLQAWAVRQFVNFNWAG
ncbi:MAG TPA: hypothetical protein VG167_08805 [Verrucomicrobiae bacterium]|nr:hypothetical protein [Verrucomicrobiae bacterium]